MRRTGVVRARGRHAFTLIEMIVVAAVALVIFAFLIRWTMTLSTVADDGLSQAAAARGTSVVDTFLGADTSRATGCSGSQDTVRTVEPRELELYIAAPFIDNIAETHLVRYAVTDGQLTRTEFVVDAANGECAPTGTGLGTRVLADGVSPTADLFTGTDAGTDAGTCATTPVVGTPNTYQSQGTGCHPSGINVSLILEPQGPGGGHDTLTRSYTLNQTGGAL